ncbi:hypothetical protein HDU83_001226 [Entophlyctis luteolus]|nr:hypothetical protein HDU83_001226 [Entophlyctis luteolus]KAJ3395034.1 hypothetical protein HDU84_004492 [Entophlyctis sp. JEL0112]
MLGLDITTLALPLRGYKCAGVDEGTSLTLDELVQLSDNDGDKVIAGFAKFHRAYLSGTLTPLDVARTFLSKIIDSSKDPSEFQSDERGYFHSILPAEVISQAAESTARYAAGVPLSALDGIPVTVKNEFDIKGHATHVGSTFINIDNPAADDADVVHRLRKLGAVILGSTTMVELGWSAIDVGPRNPHDASRSCGGSSSGSAASVAAGYAPLSIGCDGGGSVRIPAAMCGIFGLKPTHQRVSGAGEFPSCPTVAIAGPIGATADDICAGYLAIADDSRTDFPKVHVPRNYFNFPVTGLRIGVIREYNAQVFNPAITSMLKSVETKLEDFGATIVPIKMYSTVLARGGPSKLSNENALTFSAMSQCNVTDYIHAQKVRTYAINVLSDLFSIQRIDFILTPTTAITAPKLPENTSHGWSNMLVLSDVMRYAFLANLAGIPAVSCPAGVDADRLPVGIQFMGEWWSEGRLLGMCKWMEKHFGDLRVRAAGWDGIDL